MSKPLLIQEVESKAQKTYVDGQDATLTENLNDLGLSSLIPRGQLVNTVPSNNLNDVKTQGCYLILGTELNIPQNMGSFGTLICYVGGTGAIIQEVIRQYTGIRWYREFNGQSWQPWKEIATTDVAMTKFPVLRDTDLKEYIKNLEQSCTFYVHNSCTNTPIAGKYFICQVYCHINQAGYSDKHIELQDYSSKRQFYADSWNKEAIVWKEYASATPVPFTITPRSGYQISGTTSCYVIGNMAYISATFSRVPVSGTTPELPTGGIALFTTPSTLPPLMLTHFSITVSNVGKLDQYCLGELYPSGTFGFFNNQTGYVTIRVSGSYVIDRSV